MANCDFCGKPIIVNDKKKKEEKLNEGNYCEECSNKDLDELFNEILEETEKQDI